MKENINIEFELTSCAKCGFQFMLPSSFLERRRDDGRSFYCPSSSDAFSGINVHSMSYPKTVPPKPKLPTVIEREVEVIIEKEYEPKDFTELLTMHEHQFTKKNRGQVSCQICGLYQGAYELLKQPYDPKQPTQRDA